MEKIKISNLIQTVHTATIYYEKPINMSHTEHESIVNNIKKIFAIYEHNVCMYPYFSLQSDNMLWLYKHIPLLIEAIESYGLKVKI